MFEGRFFFKKNGSHAERPQWNFQTHERSTDHGYMQKYHGRIISNGAERINQ